MAPGTNLTRGSERMKNRHTERLARGTLGCLMVRFQHPTRATCLLYTVEQKDGVITYSWKRRCGYYTQTNKEPGFMAYNLIMERGLAYIGSLCSSIGKQFWGSNYPRNAGKKLWWNFQHTMPTSSQWWWKALFSLYASPQEENCHFPMGLRLWGPWCSHALVNNIHSLKTSDFQNFLHSPELRMLDGFFFSPVFFFSHVYFIF